MTHQAVGLSVSVALVSQWCSTTPLVVVVDTRIHQQFCEHVYLLRLQRETCSHIYIQHVQYSENQQKYTVDGKFQVLREDEDDQPKPGLSFCDVTVQTAEPVC